MNFDVLYENFQYAKAEGNLDKISDLLIEISSNAAEILQNATPDLKQKFQEIFLLGDTLIFQTMRMIELNDLKNAEKYFLPYINAVGENAAREFFILIFLIARLFYKNNNFPQAEKFFAMYDEIRLQKWNDKDEISLFYQGNCAAMLGKISDAKKFYEQALLMKSNFPEAENNLNVLNMATLNPGGEIGNWQENFSACGIFVIGKKF